MPATEWKPRTEVTRLKVSNRQIGEGYYGKIYRGKLWFRGKRPLAVAVKRFKRDLDDLAVHRYEKVIQRLKQQNTPMLKVGFVKHEGKWTQVMELFKTHRRELVPLFSNRSKVQHKTRSRIKRKNIDEAIETIANIANAGYSPSNDSIGLTYANGYAKVLVHDFDSLAEQERLREEAPEVLRHKQMKWVVGGIVKSLSKVGKIPEEDILEKLKKKITHEQALAAISELEAEKNMGK